MPNKNNEEIEEELATSNQAIYISKNFTPLQTLFSHSRPLALLQQEQTVPDLILIYSLLTLFRILYHIPKKSYNLIICVQLLIISSITSLHKLHLTLLTLRTTMTLY